MLCSFLSRGAARIRALLLQALTPRQRYSAVAPLIGALEQGLEQALLDPAGAKTSASHFSPN